MVECLGSETEVKLLGNKLVWPFSMVESLGGDTLSSVPGEVCLVDVEFSACAT